jgi:hypothetical protein
MPSFFANLKIFRQGKFVKGAGQISSTDLQWLSSAMAREERGMLITARTPCEMLR